LGKEHGMCGRYAITSAPEAIRRLFRYAEQPNFPPRYNIAPTQPVPIVRMMEGQRHFALVRWGLIPSWVKDPTAFTLLINARGESVNEKPAFRAAMRRRRCLFPADGFYEWKAETGRKRPYYARLKSGGPLAFAGLWETWTGPNGEEMETAAIVTTAANRTLAPIHHRMPVIVAPEAFDFWLDCEKVDGKTAAALIGPAPDGAMEAYEVSLAVNRVANDGPRLVEPVAATIGAAAPAPASPPETHTPEASQPAASRRAPRKTNDTQGNLF
jgi:putative SOS response-associated peptidase YedK